MVDGCSMIHYKFYMSVFFNSGEPCGTDTEISKKTFRDQAVSVTQNNLTPTYISKKKMELTGYLT